MSDFHLKVEIVQDLVFDLLQTQIIKSTSKIVLLYLLVLIFSVEMVIIIYVNLELLSFDLIFLDPFSFI